MGNLLPHRLDQRAELVQGTPKVPFSMMTGIEEGFSCAAFIGYHAGAGTSEAVLDHTYTGLLHRRAGQRRVLERNAPERGARGHVRRARGVRGG
jgi:D-amino peptidase